MPEPKMYSQDEMNAELEKQLAAKTEGIRNELTAERQKQRTLQESHESLKKQLDDLQAAADKAKSDKEKAGHLAKGEYDEALKKHQEESQKIIADRDAKIAEQSKSLRVLRVDNEIMAAANTAINPRQVATLLNAEYAIGTKDDGTIEILDAEKRPVLDKQTGLPLDVKGLTAKYLAENPHLVKAVGTGGAGTKNVPGSGEKNPFARDTFNMTEQIKITRENPELAAKLRTAAQGT